MLATALASYRVSNRPSAPSARRPFARSGLSMRRRQGSTQLVQVSEEIVSGFTLITHLKRMSSNHVEFSVFHKALYSYDIASDTLVKL